MKKRRSYFGWIPYYRGPFSNHCYSIKSFFVCTLRHPSLRRFGPVGWVKADKQIAAMWPNTGTATEDQ